MTSNTQAEGCTCQARQAEKLKDSCDGCSKAKTKCDRDPNTCSRCRRRGETCHYSRQIRIGRHRTSCATSVASKAKRQAEAKAANRHHIDAPQRTSTHKIQKPLLSPPQPPTPSFEFRRTTTAGPTKVVPLMQHSPSGPLYATVDTIYTAMPSYHYGHDDGLFTGFDQYGHPSSWIYPDPVPFPDPSGSIAPSTAYSMNMNVLDIHHHPYSI